MWNKTAETQQSTTTKEQTTTAHWCYQKFCKGTGCPWAQGTVLLAVVLSVINPNKPYSCQYDSKWWKSSQCIFLCIFEASIKRDTFLSNTQIEILRMVLKTMAKCTQIRCWSLLYWAIFFNLHIFSKEEVCLILHLLHNLSFPVWRVHQHMFAAQHKQPGILFCQAVDSIKQLQKTKQTQRFS